MWFAELMLLGFISLVPYCLQWVQPISQGYASLQNLVKLCFHVELMLLRSSGGATHKSGGPRPPQNLKKLFYSIYIIYI